ncbi:hypothetical protein F3Y22_tig00110963pilonHSYRG00056 [Hibiscus syriacus]|uniref:Protein kinase domain-containing protein n=1 Tax=Hibiscus syriacus TaxID=106335 RepID=A0A6A2ZA27_HIBSY|nr:hypothetical protein F3Y22_tig00110963pilonHSYRG00056 [Hibiscus syriacus]
MENNGAPDEASDNYSRRFTTLFGAGRLGFWSPAEGESNGGNGTVYGGRTTRDWPWKETVGEMINLGQQRCFELESKTWLALEAAQGLLYLHQDCAPSITHRDVKCSNILLTESLHAKLSDFGLSKAFPSLLELLVPQDTLIPSKYSTSNRLTEKSDVYSFRVVLLEIVTNQQVIMKSYEQTTHISQWASLMLYNGDIKSIVDPRLQGDFDIISMKKAVEQALACVSQTSMKRPSTNYVVAELSECLSTEVERIRQHNIQLAPTGSNSLP